MPHDLATAIGLVLVVSLVISGLLVAVLLPALRSRVMDHPNSRSSHLNPTPRGGGVAVVLALLMSMGVAAALGYTVNLAILAGCLVFAVIGAVDDFRGLGVFVRLGVQLGVAGVVAFTVLEAASLGATNLALAVGVTTIWLVSFTNSFNFMDGINGISSLSAVLAGVWYAFVGITEGGVLMAVLGSAVAGAALGFLPWNAPHARVFLGDVGSYSLGLLVGSLATLAWAKGVPLLLAVAPLIIYVTDTSVTLCWRLATGHTWHQAHRQHTYQRLTDQNLPHLVVSIIVATFATAICLAAAAFHDNSLLVAWVAVVLLAATYLAMPTLVARSTTGPRIGHG